MIWILIVKIKTFTFTYFDKLDKNSIIYYYSTKSHKWNPFAIPNERGRNRYWVCKWAHHMYVRSHDLVHEWAHAPIRIASRVHSQICVPPCPSQAWAGAAHSGLPCPLFVQMWSPPWMECGCKCASVLMYAHENGSTQIKVWKDFEHVNGARTNVVSTQICALSTVCTSKCRPGQVFEVSVQACSKVCWHKCVHTRMCAGSNSSAQDCMLVDFVHLPMCASWNVWTRECARVLIWAHTNVCVLECVHTQIGACWNGHTHKYVCAGMRVCVFMLAHTIVFANDCVHVQVCSPTNSYVCKYGSLCGYALASVYAHKFEYVADCAYTSWYAYYFGARPANECACEFAQAKMNWASL